MNVKERADAIGTFRFIEVQLMEAAAFWVPLTPEMEVKVMLGRHIWDFAQHADWLGKRTFELRQPEHYTRRASAAYVRLLERLRSAGSTAEKLSLLYDVVLPGLIRRYERYLAETDTLLDGPSVVVIERVTGELHRQIGEARRLREEMALPVSDVGALRGEEEATAHVG